MRNQRTPRDICIDQGFNFTHTLLFSLAVIQGLLAKLLIPSSLLDGSNTPRAAFLMKPPWPASSPFPWLSLCCRHRITVLQAVLSIPVNMYVFANELPKRDHLMGSFPCRQRFIMTWCFKSLNPSQRLRPLSRTPWAIGGSSICMLTVGRFFLCHTTDAQLIPHHRVTSCLRISLFIPPSPSDFTLVFTPASNHHVAKTFSFYLDFFIHSRQSLFNMLPVFTDSLCLLVHMLILSWHSGYWLRAGCPYPKRLLKSPCNGRDQPSERRL